jgi:hypothetical protein
MGVSPGTTPDWKNSMPSSAGVFGEVAEIGLEPELDDLEALLLGIETEGFGLP